MKPCTPGRGSTRSRSSLQKHTNTRLELTGQGQAVSAVLTCAGVFKAVTHTGVPVCPRVCCHHQLLNSESVRKKKNTNEPTWSQIIRLKSGSTWADSGAVDTIAFWKKNEARVMHKSQNLIFMVLGAQTKKSERSSHQSIINTGSGATLICREVERDKTADYPQKSVALGLKPLTENLQDCLDVRQTFQTFKRLKV